ncbi:hypothetical protein HYPSUDRAFT_47021 [Hypholoma sublateritium FD-334 SS-4]|uniref:F-box domain-containing protein n=1 Tax=Hypholoma sublateritium (strain FD-334 SS-4) TaxID=945553 RepID=A0A0D2NCC6_HYPSF|nr:hypothetical protein HYPSUDRAFT_47021 [Hypholoma sublateritium FD-334 SS-4]
MAILLDLPTELLLDILKRNGTGILDLYPIALVSRRLNSIAIPLAFPDIDTHDIENVFAITFDGPSCELTPKQRDTAEVSWDIRGIDAGLLLFAFDITSVDDIYCTFLDPLLEASALSHNLTRFAYFVARLTAVRSVTLWLKVVDEHRYARSHPHSAFPTSIANILNYLLQLLAIKGCKHLFIYDETHGTPTPLDPMAEITGATTDTSHFLSEDAARRAINTTPQQPAHHTRKTGMISKLASRLANSPFKSKSRSLPSSKLHTRTKITHYSRHATPFSSLAMLRSIHLQSAIPLLPLCLPELLSLIRGSVHTLTSLTLSRISLDQHIFNSSLSGIMSPEDSSITHFSVTNCIGIWPKTLLDILRYLQDRLEYLELDKTMALLPEYRPDSPIKHLHFPQLHIVDVPLDWMVYIVGHPTNNSLNTSNPNYIIPLPALSSMSLYCRTIEAINFTYSVFHPSLSAVLEPIYFQKGPLLRRGFASDMKISLEITLDEDKEKEWQMDNDRAVLNMTASSYYKSNIPPTTSRAPLPWHLVTYLRLCTSPPEDTFEAHTLARWVTTIFPGVVEVEILLPGIIIDGVFPPPSDRKAYQKHALDILSLEQSCKNSAKFQVTASIFRSCQYNLISTYMCLFSTVIYKKYKNRG